MDKFIKHTGTCVPLFEANIDTDQIVPKKFLLRIERAGFAEALFHDWRYEMDGTVRSDFILNNPKFKGSSIFLAGSNFGCGSSREHAPWALFEYGFRVIIAPSFADIFYSNCFKIGLLPIQLAEEDVVRLVKSSNDLDEYELTVDLTEKTIFDQNVIHLDFEIDDFVRESLLNGFDNIDLTLMKQTKIENYEKTRVSFVGKPSSP